MIKTRYPYIVGTLLGHGGIDKESIRRAPDIRSAVSLARSRREADSSKKFVIRTTARKGQPSNSDLDALLEIALGS